MAKRDTILYIGGFELPDKNAAAHRVVAHGKIFNQNGYEVNYIGIDHDIKETNILKTKEKFLDGNRFRVMYPKGIKNWIWYLVDINHINKVIKSLDSEVKMIIAYNYPSVALFRLIKYCKKNGIALVSDCTEWYVPKGGLVFNLIKGFDSNFRMRFVHKKLDGLIAISSYLYNYYSKMDNVIKIPPLVDKTDPKWDIIKDTNSQLLRFIYAGSPGNKDKIDELVKAFGIIKSSGITNFQLDVVGISESEFLNFYKFRKKELIDNAKFHGRVSNKQALRFLKNADFSIFIREDNLVSRAGFPTKFAEAMAAGVPVITNRTSNIKDYLIEGENGFFIDYSSIGALVNTLKEIIKIERDQILKLKSNCSNNKKFDITEYSLPLKKFVNNIILNHE